MDQNAQNAQNQTQNIDDIQKHIAEVLNLTDVTDEKQKEFIQQATEVLLKKIFLAVVDKLSEEDQNKYLDLLEKEEQPEEIRKFLDEKIPEYDKFAQGIIDEFVTGLRNAGAAKAEEGQAGTGQADAGQNQEVKPQA